MAGRKPLPDEIKKQKGTFQACRSNPDAPELQAGRPNPPKDLNDEELAAFWSIADATEATGVCDPRHHHAMTLFARSWARAQRCYDEVRDKGETDESGKKRPEATVADSAAKECRMILASFGLTPADMGRVAAKKPEKKDETDPWAEHGFDMPGAN